MIYVTTIALGMTVRFTYLGVISGALQASSTFCLFASIEYIGLAVGATIWSGTAVLISFAEGFFVSTHVHTPAIAIAGVLVLLAGIVGVGISPQMVSKLCGNAYDSPVYRESKTSPMASDIEMYVGCSANLFYKFTFLKHHHS